MFPFRSKFVFFIAASALTAGCTSVGPNYAPVTTNHPDLPNTPVTPKDETKYHQVKKGDTLYAISVLYDLDYRQIAQWNRITPPYTIEIGIKIRLSAPNSGAIDSENTSPQRREEEQSPEQLPATPKIEETTQKIVTATATTRFSSQNKNANSSNIKSNLAYKPSAATQPLKIPAEKLEPVSQKKPIISIDNENMLKLNFQWPIKGKVLKNFSPTDNKGIDIVGKMGQDVNAAEAGKVVYSGQGLIGYGNLLIIKHNDLYLTAYANNSQLLVAEGEMVGKGETIAKVGQAGSNKTSLHFEIRKNGKPVNPLNFLPEK